MKRLLEMLTYRRPAGGETDWLFRSRFILCDERAQIDKHGNIIIEVGEGSTTLFSCHTDTVHKDEGIQTICADEVLGIAYKDDKEPLGADDTAGCWIMMKMIEAEVPGVYVFHFGEECGGIGSSDKAREEPDWFKRFRRAVAFDRRGTEDVITHQAWGRCCSETFAKALAAQLNETESGLDYKPCDGGIFTDTGNYVELVPECTNLSVGYDGEHTGGENLDLIHIERVLRASILVDWEALPTDRDPKKVDRDIGFTPHFGHGSYMAEMRATDILDDYQWDAEEIAYYAGTLEEELDQLRQKVKKQSEKKREKKRRRAENRKVRAITSMNTSKATTPIINEGAGPKSLSRRWERENAPRTLKDLDGFAPPDPWEQERCLF